MGSFLEGVYEDQDKMHHLNGFSNRMYGDKQKYKLSAFVNDAPDFAGFIYIRISYGMEGESWEHHLDTGLEYSVDEGQSYHALVDNDPENPDGFYKIPSSTLEHESYIRFKPVSE